MSKLSQPQRVFELLKQSPLKKFKAREIAEGIVTLFPEDYVEKRQNPRFKTDDEFISQVFAEIGALKHNILKLSPYIHVQDKPRPRVYWYDPNHQAEHGESFANEELTSTENIEETEINLPLIKSGNLSEHDLYPLLIEFLRVQFGLSE